jgi:hypothetical protein
VIAALTTSEVMTPTGFGEALDGLDADALDQLGVLLRERARLRRVLLSPEDAQRAIDEAPLSPSWERSRLQDVGRVRKAARLLVEQGWHRDQVRSVLIRAAEDRVPHPRIAVEAVDAGLSDARDVDAGAR